MNELIEKLKAQLEHWKEVRESGRLSKEEKSENLRCAVDILESLEQHLILDERKKFL